VNRNADFFQKKESIRIDSLATNGIESIRIANWNALPESDVGAAPKRLGNRSVSKACTKSRRQRKFWRYRLLLANTRSYRSEPPALSLSLTRHKPPGVPPLTVPGAFRDRSRNQLQLVDSPLGGGTASVRSRDATASF